VGALQARGTRLVSLRRLTREDALTLPFAWTPDSKAILLGSDRYGQVRIYKQDIDEDTAELITSGPGSQRVPRMSPDGRWVLYLSHDVQVGIFGETPGHPKTRLMRIPLAGDNAQEILPVDHITGWTCSNTPGRACVFAEARGNVSTFSLLDPVKGRGAKVRETVQPGSPESTAAGPAISPDGQHIAFVLRGTPPKPNSNNRPARHHRRGTNRLRGTGS
jgi:WD40-like Beta Propeller Repeat